MARRHEIAAIQLAIDIAADRGAGTIWGATAGQCLDEGLDIDPLTLARGDEVERAHFLPASAKDCVALDLLSKLLNFVSFDRKKAEKDKAMPTNLVALHALFRRKMVKDEVAFLPTYDQLLLLIPEVERLASDCIQPLYNDERWTMTVNLSKSAREYPLRQDQREEGDEEESREGQEGGESLWAHAFEALAFPRGQLRLHEYNDTAERGEVTHDAVPLEQAESSSDERQWSRWDEEWPLTRSFVSPVIAILCWVNMVNRTGLPIPECMKAYYDLSIELCRVAVTSSGKTLAQAVYYDRPDIEALPALAPEVEKTVTDLGEKEEHSRDFELPEEESSDEDASDSEARRGGQGDGGAKRKRATDEGSSQKAKKQAVSSSSRSGAASESSTSTSTAKGKARAPSDPLQVSLSALQQDFDAATSRVTAAELRFFRELIKDLVIDGGDVPLFALVRGMEAVYELVGDARTQELKTLLREWQDAEDALKEVQVTLEWVTDAQRGM